MTNFYQVKKLAKKKTKTKVKKTVEVMDQIDAGPGVYTVNGINVQRGTRSELMPRWVQENAMWHINLKGGDRDRVFHVSREGIPMVHYYFKGTGTDIEGVRPTAKEMGSSSIKKDADGDDVKTKRSFDDLPADVQGFIRNNWAAILG